VRRTDGESRTVPPSAPAAAPPEPASGPAKLRLGGMALQNGLLVHGPTHWAAAVRTREGRLAVASGEKPKLSEGAAQRLPGLRGIARLAEAMAVIPLAKRALPEAQLPMQDARTLASMAAAAAGGSAARKGRPRTLGREAVVAALSLLPALLALRGGELASYHGVEHKAIGAYEEGADAVEATKEHERCGSNLVAPLLLSTVAGNVAVRRAGLRGPAADAVVALGSLGVAVEVFGWSERHADSALSRWLRRPGYEIQRFVGTREPTEDQLEVGRAALAEVLRAEGLAEGPAGGRTA
jgi:uncharacterized protein YqhQ